jgi:hypothetical protein
MSQPSILKVRSEQRLNNNVPISFAVPISQPEVYRQNFLASPFFDGEQEYEIIELNNYRSASAAYNAAKEIATYDLIVYVHQDVILPKYWSEQLFDALKYLETHHLNWGVLGCIGISEMGDIRGSIYCTGNNGYIGKHLEIPEAVATLDEVVLIANKSSNLKFDPGLPFFHFYGTDLCLAARKKGMSNYVIPAFCIHNSKKTLFFPREFYKCAAHIRNKYPEFLPIATTCTRLTKSAVRDHYEWWKRNLRHVALLLHSRHRYGNRKNSADLLADIRLRPYFGLNNKS